MPNNSMMEQVNELVELYDSIEAKRSDHALALINKYSASFVQHPYYIIGLIETAIRTKNPLVLEKLLKVTPVSTWEFNFDQKFGKTPLYYAYEIRDRDILKLLIQYKATLKKSLRSWEKKDISQLITNFLDRWSVDNKISQDVLYNKTYDRLEDLSFSAPELKTLLDAPKVPHLLWQDYPGNPLPNSVPQADKKEKGKRLERHKPSLSKTTFKKLSVEEATKKIQFTFRKFRHKKQETLGKVQWMTGSNGYYVLPGVVRTNNTLIPTGKLRLMGIVPIAGEQNYGMRTDGINQTSLSGVGPNNFDVAWTYAKMDPQTIKSTVNDIVDSLEKNLIPNLLGFCGKRGAVSVLCSINTTLLKLRQLDEALYQEKTAKTMELLLNVVNTDDFWFEANYCPKAKKLLDEDCKTLKDLISLDPNVKHNWPEIIAKFKQAGFPNTPLSISVNLNEQVKPQLDSYTLHQHISYAFSNRALADIVVFFKSIKDFDPKKLAEIREQCLAYLKNEEFVLERERQLFRSILMNKPRHCFSAEDPEVRKPKRPFPIVFSTTHTLRVQGTEGGAIGELSYKGSLKLGDELNVLITDDQNQQDLRQFLRAQQLRHKVLVCTDTEFLKAKAKR